MADHVAEIISLAREIWPKATSFKVTPSTVLYSEELGTKITNWQLTYYHRDCDGDELGSYITGDSAAALRDKLKAMKEGKSDG